MPLLSPRDHCLLFPHVFCVRAGVDTDSFGRDMRDNFESVGIDTSHVHHVAKATRFSTSFGCRLCQVCTTTEAPTGAAAINVDASGKNMISVRLP